MSPSTLKENPSQSRILVDANGRNKKFRRIIPESTAVDSSARIRILIARKVKRSMRPVATFQQRDSNQDDIAIDPNIERLRLLFLADGNQRATNQGKKGYSMGGNNVIRTAETAARYYPDQIEEIVACIMSEENAKKRGDDLFEQMYKPFVGLGLDIKDNNRLVRDGICMTTYGDLDLLRKTVMGSRLADMIKKSCDLTAVLENPTTTLTLGVGYNPQIAQDLLIDAIFRSGMEEAAAVRLSGIETSTRYVQVNHGNQRVLCPTPIPIIGTTTLWPDFEPAKELPNIVQLFQKRSHIIEMMSYDVPYIAATIREGMNHLQLQLPNLPNLEITIPFNNDEYYLRDVLDKWHRAPDTSNMRVELIKNDEMVDWWGKSRPDAKIVWRIACDQQPQLQRISRRTRVLEPPISTHEYDFIVAQDVGEGAISTASIDSSTRMGWATVLLGDCSDPRNLTDLIRRAVVFREKHPQLKGGPRNKKASPNVDSWAEFDRYGELQLLAPEPGNDNGGHVALEDTFNNLGSREEFLEQYNYAADISVAKMLEWASKFGKDVFSLPVQKRAFTGYTFTAFFLAFYPNHPMWEILKEDWQGLFDFVAKYMEIVFLMDEYIADVKISDPIQKKALIDFSMPYFIRSIKSGKIRTEEISPDLPQRKWIAKISAAFRRLGKDARKEGIEGEFYPLFLESIIELIEAHKNEWDHSFLDPQIFADLKTDPEKRKEFEDKYSSKMPGSIKAKMSKALDEFCNGDHNKLYDLQLYIYLSQSAASIGAKPVYYAIACYNSNGLGKQDPEMLHALQELADLNNIYYRLANDIAELFRDFNDQENKVDASFIMRNKHSLPDVTDADITLNSVSELLTMLDDLRAEIIRKRDALLKKSQGNKKWMQIALSIVRSDIVKSFYDGTHYRVATRDQVRQFFDQHFDLGIT